jgi:hypothetical protein
VHDSGLGLDSIARMPPAYATLRQKTWENERKRRQRNGSRGTKYRSVLTMS